MTTVNRSGLADILGCALATVDKYMRDGLPVLDKPGSGTGSKEYRFDTAAVIKWMIEQAGGKGQKDPFKTALQREKSAQAGLRELELAEKQGRLVTIEDTIEVAEEQLSIVKSRLTVIPGRLAQALSIESDPEKCRKMLEKEVSEALEAISGV